MSCTANELIKVAQSWVGYSEKNGKFKEILEVYNSHKPLAQKTKIKATDEWCDCFISACAIKAGAVDLIGAEISCEKHVAIFMEKGVWIEDGTIKPEAEAAVMNDLRAHFRPEFLNRLDETILFKPLTKENLNGIIDILMKGLKQRLADKTLKLEVTDSAKTLLIDRGFDPVYGARPLKRYLQSSAETLIAKEILRGELPAGSTLVLDAENGELVCKKGLVSK